MSRTTGEVLLLDAGEGEGFGGGGRRYSYAWERIILRSWDWGGGLAFFLRVGGVSGGLGEGLWGEGGGLTESVHLKWPRNMRVSVVVTRRVLLRREVR